MRKVDYYRQELRRRKHWTPYLRAQSGLPGPRGNLELASAVAQEATPGLVGEWLALSLDDAPENTPGVFLVFCAVLTLGRLVVEGQSAQLASLRQFASDPRWRIREAVAMALQTIGDSDMDLLVKHVKAWSEGNPYEQRAAAAALAEPRLLKSERSSAAALRILDAITESLSRSKSRNTEAFKTLRQGLGYCWSVTVASNPAQGKPLILKWLKSADPDVRWIIRENLRKSRLMRMDARWVKACQRQLEA